MKNETAVQPNQESTALARVHEPMVLEPQVLIQNAIAEKASIEVMERLFELATKVQADFNRRAWYAAMADFQRECPAVLRSSTANIATKSGTRFSYTYANLADIMATIQPVMGQYGLSVSFRTEQQERNVIVICRVSHAAGHHEESGKIAMPIPTADMGATEPQRVGIALTYAKRYALLAITGIAPQDDEDDQDGGGRDKAGVSMPQRASEATEPHRENGGDLTTKQVSRLWAIAFAAGKLRKAGEDAVKSKVNALLGLAGATSVSELSKSGYDEVCGKLEEWGKES